jgi:hypothetical protein
MKGLERLFLVLVLVLMVSACSNPLDSSESGVSAGLGVDRCYTCHLDTGYTYYNASFALTIQQIFTDWSQSAHGNSGNFPDTNYFFNPSPGECAVCHDRNLDSQNLALLAAAGAPGGSATPRPVISCEACHGSGDGHINAFFTVPYSTPDYERCGQCHNASFNEVTHTNPEGDEIFENYRSSKHAVSINSFIFTPFGGTNLVKAKCSKCHTDEGGKFYAGIPWSTILDTAPVLSNVNSVQCRTCHFAHNPGNLLVGATGSGSKEFNTCTNCHELDDSGIPAIPIHSPAINPFGSSEEIITDTHFGEPGNWPSPFSVNLDNIAGYAISFTDERSCRNCHNVHSGNLTINEQWAASAHADTSAPGAWAHYNWTSFGGGSCQRCHTTTGVIAYLTANSQATTPYSPPLSSDAGYRPEMLHCNGCHSDNAGGLRTPGAIIGDYTDAPFTFPDVAGSNVCMACHTGQESGESIKNMSSDFGSIDFVNSHYLTAGGTIFQATGYEFAATYDNFSFYEHDQIGITETEGIGTEGPCVGCHLSSPESHHFLPVEHSAAGTITSITSTVCDECHAGQFALTAVMLEEEKEDLHASLEALKAAMADTTVKPAFFFTNSFPYVFEDAGFTTPTVNWASFADTSANFETTGKLNMGAVFNFNLLEHDPGSYAHNSLYTRLLIFDSIDWLDNNLLDGVIDLTAFPAAAEYLQRDESTGNDSVVTRPPIY